MRVLITNDDGIQSPGIQELSRHIESAGYEVVVVAPDHDASGTGTSLGRISSEEPVNVSRHSIPGLRAEAYGISGSPALCVVTGYLEAFGPVPDIVVSGINAGLNTGRSTLHSGTVHIIRIVNDHAKAVFASPQKRGHPPTDHRSNTTGLQMGFFFQ